MLFFHFFNTSMQYMQVVQVGADHVGEQEREVAAAAEGQPCDLDAQRRPQRQQLAPRPAGRNVYECHGRNDGSARQGSRVGCSASTWYKSRDLTVHPCPGQACERATDSATGGVADTAMGGPRASATWGQNVASRAVRGRRTLVARTVRDQRCCRTGIESLNPDSARITRPCIAAVG